MNDSPAQRLRQARIDRGYETAADAARAHGWNLVTYTAHENGSRGITRKAAIRYAQAFNVPAARLLGLSTSDRTARLSTSSVPVIASAAVGVWRDRSMFDESSDATGVYVPDNTRNDRGNFGISIDDESVNRAIPRNAVAICTPLSGTLLASLPEGALVAVRRSRNGMQEVSIRRIAELTDKAARLTSYSSDARYREVLTIEHGDPTLEILGRVVGIYTPLSV